MAHHMPLAGAVHHIAGTHRNPEVQKLGGNRWDTSSLIARFRSESRSTV